MFAVIYQVYVKKGLESEYQQAWHVIANYFIQERGAIGSSLHKASNGLWVAYSKWPDKKTRDASWPGENAPSPELPPKIQKAILILKDSADSTRKIPEICMEVIEDLSSHFNVSVC